MSLCPPPLQFRLNIISNSNSQRGIFNLFPLQCFINIILLHQHFLARDCGMVDIKCIGECIYLFFNTGSIYSISSINVGAFTKNYFSSILLFILEYVACLLSTHSIWLIDMQLIYSPRFTISKYFLHLGSEGLLWIPHYWHWTQQRLRTQV